ncbi:hypothetical protein TW83_14835 [Paracoccus sp. S4493]|nr:hypothetical protein TW83_14835 [Paracoccus sp. S4493]
MLMALKAFCIYAERRLAFLSWSLPRLMKPESFAPPWQVGLQGLFQSTHGERCFDLPSRRWPPVKFMLPGCLLKWSTKTCTVTQSKRWSSAYLN